jgi:hypothetical protein
MKRPHLLISSGVALLALLLTYILLENHAWIGDTEALQQWSDKTFTTQKPNPTQFIFVDVSRSFALLGIGQEDGKRAVTDRQKLTYFFWFLNRFDSQHQWLLCDVLLDTPALPTDSLQKSYEDSLRIELSKAKRFTVAGVKGKNKHIFRPLIFPNLPMGLVTTDLGGTHNVSFRLEVQGYQASLGQCTKL